MREIRYRAIADELRRRVEAGEFAAGRTLPSEAELSAAYEASRVTVRKALEVLRDEGLVDARQGFGWFVAVDPLRQSLGRLGTIEGQLAESGVRSERRILDFGFVPAPPRVRSCSASTTVLEVRRLNLADGEPFARVTVWCPEELGAHLCRADVERVWFYELIDQPLGGAAQTIGAAVAAAATPSSSRSRWAHRCSAASAPRRIPTDEPVLVSEHVFPAHLTEFVVDLPLAEPSIAATGLRLVE